MAKEDDLKERLEALERENKELKKAAAQATTQPKTIRYSIGDYKGHPTITFEIAGRHLTLGLRKAAVILRCVDLIRSFVNEHHAELTDWEVVRTMVDGDRSSDDSDLQI